MRTRLTLILAVIFTCLMLILSSCGTRGTDASTDGTKITMIGYVGANAAKAECTEHVGGDWITDVDATCLSNGTKHIECIYCSTVIREGNIPAKGHNFSEYVYDGNVTCTTDGTKTSVCLNGCGKFKTLTDEDHLAKGHITGNTVIENYVSSGCNDGGYDEVTYCAICGVELSRSSTVIIGTGHIQSNWIIDIEPLCATNGLSHIECTVCHETLKTSISPSLGHIESDWMIDVHPFCETNGSRHKFCLVCLEVITTENIPAIGHKFTNYSYDNNASCTLMGTKTASCDNRCGETHTIPDYFYPPLGHIGGNATCLALAVCERCELEYGNYANHEYNEWVIIEPPTCNEMGLQSTSCVFCESTITATLATTHVLDGNWTVEVKSTCTAKGSRYSLCTVCNSQVYESIPPIDHTPGEWETEVEATCTSSGTINRKCIYCDMILSTAVIYQGHEQGEYVSNGDGTHSAHCTLCGCLIYTKDCRYIDTLIDIDVKCEICGGDMIIAPDLCSHACHSDDFLTRLWWGITLWFSRLFGLNAECSCGLKHY